MYCQCIKQISTGDAKLSVAQISTGMTGFCNSNFKVKGNALIGGLHYSTPSKGKCYLDFAISRSILLVASIAGGMSLRPANF